jgi:hypothetical protein
MKELCGSRFMEKIAAKRHPRIILVKITNRISIKAPETINYYIRNDNLDQRHKCWDKFVNVVKTIYKVAARAETGNIVGWTGFLYFKKCYRSLRLTN